MKLKRFIVPGVVAGLIATGLTMPIGADDGVIQTTVTPLVLSVNVNQTSIDYGSLEYSAADNDRETAESGTISATNKSSVLADLRIKGSDATSATAGHSTWVLNCSPDGVMGTVAVDQYVHRFAAGGTTFAGSAPALCKTTTKLLFEDVAPDGAIDFDLQWNMPLQNTTGGNSARTSTVTVIAVLPNTVP